MDLRLTPAETGFRDEVRAFLEANVPAEWRDPGWRQPEGMLERLELVRWWERRLRDAGLTGLHWPKEYGGRGASLVEQAIFEEELARYDVVAPWLSFIGVNLVGPTLIAHGSEEQKGRYLPRILAFDDIWCQLFSEPDAGSDLASVRTRAVLAGDHFVVEGQKVWTSWAQVADHGILLCRTDPSLPKHQGLSFLIVDMRAPGVELRPLRQITGESEFNEVRLAGVRVPRENLVGALGQGWRIALTTLTHERGTAMFGVQVRQRRAVRELAERARRTPLPGGGSAADDPVLRERIAQAYVECEVVRSCGHRMLAASQRTGHPGALGSLTKLFLSEQMRRFTRTAMEVAGPGELLHGQEPDGRAPRHRYDQEFLGSFAMTIGAGTSQIQRNVVARHVLGLPRGE